MYNFFIDTFMEREVHMRYIFIIATFLLAFSPSAYSDETLNIEAFTAKLPPFTINPKDNKPGFLHELVVEMAKRSNVNMKINYLPWKRAQKKGQETPNSIVFGMTRTSKREPLYNWLVNLVEPDYVFVSTKAPVNNYDEARKLKAISVLAGTPRERLLKKEKFGNTQSVNKVELNAKKLKAGRVDTWFTLSHRAAYIWLQQGFSADKLIIGKSLKKTETWLGGNKVLPKGLKERFEKSLASIKADGTYEKLFKKYFGNVKL